MEHLTNTSLSKMQNCADVNLPAIFYLIIIRTSWAVPLKEGTFFPDCKSSSTADLAHCVRASTALAGGGFTLGILLL